MGTQEDSSDTKEDHHHQAWGTWDDLLLASAVKRHGFHSWDSVSMEVQSRTSLPLPLTAPDHCRLRYLHLKRRFSPHPHPHPSPDDADADDKVVHIPWLEELRKLRVAELQQEVQRYDVSILSLQLKVKKLEEEREESLREKHQKPDLAEDEDSKGDRSVKDKRDADGEPESSAADRLAAKSAAAAAGEESDRENRSVNESNSTGVKSERDKTGDEAEEGEGGGGRKRAGENEPARAGTGSEKTDRVSEGTKPEVVDSYNGSSEPNRERRGEEGEGEEGEEEEERPESVAQSKENSSDVQSSASLTNKKNKRKRKGRRLVEISAGEEQQQGTEEASPAVDLGGKKESQPLLEVLKMIRAHKHATAFERRLPLQESEKYRGMVRQHMDLEGIESRVERGSYSSSLPFYRDLLLLFNNALVFYPKSSVESLAALDLQRLVSSHFRKAPAPAPAPASHSLSHSQRSSSTPDAPERSDPLLAKHKSSTPIIVCRKRSSMSSQQPVNNNDKKPALDSKPAHEQGLIKMNASAATKERSVTGTRSLRRSSTKIMKNSSPPPNPSKKQTPTSTSIEKAENSNSKAEGMVTASTKKRSAADFLKRIKRNSPAGGKSKNSGSESSNNNTSNNKKASSKNNKNKKSEKGGEEKKDESSPSKPRTVGRPPKKGGTPEYSNVKRGREVGGKESASAAASTSALKRPRKRARR
ncbi:uncharacterized protein LOC115691704 [Syzygium oleosum]|uniref:uncharacterized protein LOC115691704 n=1 Tax=Syzygium oleosum TaxID=219896 RepID=UPI0011D2256B|nr:uncharacterized protein LOC115691704 [Syzygium oleosum]